MGKSSIVAVEEKLPPGFRFYPRDEELICDYLMNRVVVLMACDSTCTPHTNSSLPLLIEVDLNKTEPWQIPETACVGGKQWYFYSRRDKKYATGLRTNRATGTGYWKATGKDRIVSRGSPASVVGMRKTLVFYRGRAPKGRKSDWVMHEFRLEGSSLQPLMFSSFTKEDLVLCRVFHKDKEDKYVSGSHVDHRRITSASLSSLPPLMDDPYISFTQTQSNSNFMMNHPSNLQVPCFSIFSQNQTMSYCYPSVVAANVPELQSNNAPSPRFKSCSSNSGAYDVVEADSDQRNRPNLKVVTSNDPASNKLKSKISSCDDDFGDGNRDSYLSMSMWRHHQY